MGNPVTLSFALPTPDADGIAQSQAVAGAGNLTLNGALVSGGVASLVVAQRVGIASSGADSALTFTVYGTDRNSHTISETVTGVATPTTVNTLQDFLTVTRIAVSGAAAGNITVGTVGVGSTRWLVDNMHLSPFALSIGTQVVSGSVTYTVEYTLDDPNNLLNVSNPPPQNVPIPYPDQVVQGATVTTLTGRDTPVFAHRVTVNSGTGTLRIQSMQSGIRS